MELNQKVIDAAYKLMEYKTKEYLWYTDTPEKPFIYSEGSVWLINPETKEWFLEIKKTGDMNYFYDKFDNFHRYLNMKRSEFEMVLKNWVEDILEKKIYSTTETWMSYQSIIKKISSKNVVKYELEYVSYKEDIADVLEKGIVVSFYDFDDRNRRINEVLENGKQLNKNEDIFEY